VKILLPVLFGVVITAQPLVNEEILEPSVANEVWHALSRSPTNAPPATAEVQSRAFAWTNGLSRSAIAVRLVSEQQGDGRWIFGTNDVTAAVVRMLEASL
jgi:hypothetical protein